MVMTFWVEQTSPSWHTGPYAFTLACSGIPMNAVIDDLLAAYKVAMWPGSVRATGDALSSNTQEGNTCWACTHSE